MAEERIAGYRYAMTIKKFGSVLESAAFRGLSPAGRGPQFCQEF